jgi:cytochrome d ubiquinol oxidase subunit I
MWMILFLAPAQVVMGDFHGLNTLEYQPSKVAAMEGNWKTSSNVPLLLFALPSNETQSNLFELGVPNMASIILKHDAEGVVPGLDATPREEQPPVAPVFWSFRVMVGIGMLMVLAGISGLISRVRRNLYTPSVFHRFLVAMIPAPFIAVVSGWFVTEMGRSPWLVHGLMSQSEGITPSLTGPLALTSLIGFVLVYAVVYASGFVYIMKTVRKGTEND